MNITKLTFTEKCKIFCELSHSVYLEKEYIVERGKVLNLPNIKIEIVNGLKILICLLREDIIISIKGGNSLYLKDFVKELHKAKVSFFNTSEGYIYKKILRDFEKLWERLSSFSIDKRNIWLCGHGEGGALAVLVGAKLQAKEVFTFGCPKFCDDSWVKKHDYLVHRRLVFCKDPLPTLPKHKFKHHGKEYYITTFGIVKEKDVSKSKKYLDHTVHKCKFWSKGKKFNELEDHDLKNYLKCF